MKKKLLLLMIPILMVSTSVLATDNIKDDTITKNIIINKSEENNFESSIEKMIEINGIKYHLENTEKEELETTESMTIEQAKSIEISTNDRNTALKIFAQSIEFNDGEYAGILYIQEGSLEMTEIKHGSYEKVDIIEKEYSDLQEADLDYIPKEINQNGYTYVLTNCDWKITENENIQNISIPKTYIANTIYKAVKTMEYPYTYVYTIKYIGDVNKTSTDKIKYTISYKQETQKYPEIKENKTSILPYLGGTGVFLVVIFFLLPNAKITNYYNGKYRTIKYIRVSTKNPKVKLTNLPRIKTNAISIKFNSKLAKKLEGKTVEIITPKVTYKKMIMNKSIEIHL